MKYAKLFLFLFAGLLMVSVPTFGQDGPPPGEGPRDDRRPNLLAKLGLAPEQIRRMNQERQPRMRAARMRMGDAQRNLDRAIYSDTLVSDAEFQTLLKEFQAAQADLNRLRFEGELAVRKILTPEQLVRFRDIRRQFAEENRDRMQDRRFMRRRQDGALPQKDNLAPKRPIN